jgi:hypothetical protein
LTIKECHHTSFAFPIQSHILHLEERMATRDDNSRINGIEIKLGKPYRYGKKSTCFGWKNQTFMIYPFFSFHPNRSPRRSGCIGFRKEDAP